MKEQPIKLVADTNALFMALYNPLGKVGMLINFAIQEKIILFSPDSVKIELFNVVQRELEISEEETNFIIESLPVNWVDESIYIEAIDRVKVKHEPDKPVEALSILLNCEILTADHHFKNRADIDEILKKIKTE